AENRADNAKPFAFLATYTAGVSAEGKLVHRPLSHAVTDSAQRGDKSTLLGLLAPLERGAAHSPFVAECLQTGAIYRPHALTPEQAWRFLCEVPDIERAGLSVRIPDWWRTRSRALAQGRLDTREDGLLGAGVLLDFDVDIVVDGEPLTPEEVDGLLVGTRGLRWVRGRWVEVDPERLEEVLRQFRIVADAAARDELDFITGMRLLARVTDATIDAGEALE